MNDKLFDQFEALTFDDVLIVPGYTEVLPNETDTSTQLTPDICLNVPSHDTPRIQEVQITIGHILCDLVDFLLFPEAFNQS